MGLFDLFKKKKGQPVAEYKPNHDHEPETMPEPEPEPVRFFKPHEYALEVDGDDVVAYRKYRYDDVSLAGVSYREIDYSLLSPGGLTLEQEPDNPYDPNAVKVVSYKAGHIGYVPKGKLLDMVNDYINTDGKLVLIWLVGADESTQTATVELAFYVMEEKKRKPRKKKKARDEFDDFDDDEW